MKHLLFYILLLPFSCLAQLSVETTALFGSKEALPFWFTHNQSGRYATTGQVQSLTEAQLLGSAQWPKNLTFTYGADLALLVTDKEADANIIQAWAGLSGKWLRLQGGAFEEEEQMGGLSSSNGHILRSLNYRPAPRLRLSTPGFLPIPFTGNKLFIRGEYDESLLTDTRFTDRPHLHHKSLALLWASSPSLRLTAGVDHYVFWGGTSPTRGELPDSFSDYFRYITGRSGTANFSDTDRLNAAGNHLGAYLLSAEKSFERFSLRLQLSHPFEDGSGMSFENIRDNLYSLYWRNNRQGSLLDELVVEYLYTKHQSGDRSDEQHLPVTRRHGVDNYFNHEIYITGFTYHGYSMGTPLFEPLQYNAQGLVTGVANNRVSGVHLGARGTISPTLSWKTLFTYTRNFGTYLNPYLSVRPQFYSMAQLGWQSPRLPLSLSALMGTDIGELVSDKVGIGCRVRWIF